MTALTINISETHNFLDLPRETGTYRREVENGIVHTFTVEDGKIVKHEAVNREGKQLATSQIRIVADYIHNPGGGGSPAIPVDSPKCYYCTNDSDYSSHHSCWSAPCAE
jgi:hypothetical protein